MSTKKNKWNTETIMKESLKYTTLKDFREASRSALIAAQKLGIYEEVVSHLARAHTVWTKVAIATEAAKYSALGDFNVHARGAVSASKALGIFEEVTSHMTRSTVKPFTRENLAALAKEFEYLKDFRTECRAAYAAVCRLGILKEVTGSLKKQPSTSPIYSVKGLKGLYILYDGIDIVYVGKSIKDVSIRIERHLNDKQFTKAVVYVIDSDADIHVAELYLINKYKPRYNVDCLGESVLTLNIDNLNDIITEEVTIEFQ